MADWSDAESWALLRAHDLYGGSWKAVRDGEPIFQRRSRNSLGKRGRRLVDDGWHPPPGTPRLKLEAEKREPAPPEPGKKPDSTNSVLLTKKDISRITTLDDLLAFFKVDQEAWAVRNFKVNKWEQHSNAKGITPLYQVRANLERNIQRDAELARAAYEQAKRDMQAHSPRYGNDDLLDVLTRGPGTGPVLYEVAPFDAHLGMLAWGKETGGPDYDLSIACRDYVGTVRKSLAFTSLYNTERILFVVGNDLIHADTLQGGKIATTTAGTAQDMDGRLPKIFSAARRAVVECVDMCRRIAPTDVLVVSGNHDRHTAYRLGEVVYAWYRLDDRVNVIYSPAKRLPYQYGKNGFLFTHGEEFKRKREPLALIFADEFPRLWAESQYREVHCGHYHATKAKKYDPEPELDETRGVRLRVLAALTSSDAWHVEEGYRHHRAVTGLAFHRSGGLAGFHEFTPDYQST